MKLININSEEEKNFYNKIGKTIGWDFSNMKFDVVDNSKFQYFDEINKNILPTTVLLDIGTGGGEKLINLISNNCLMKIGTDFSKEMVNTAIHNITKESNNVKFFEMDSESILFPSEFFDIICARHTPFNVEEIYRVLKSKGIFISEQVDEDDCLELKRIFGRGQGYDSKIKLKEKIEKELNKKDFSNVEFFEIIQEEYYKTEEDVLFLLNNTPIIPNFGNEKNDYEKFNLYIEKNKTEKGIYLERKLFGIKIVK